jgi:hypothetical protein
MHLLEIKRIISDEGFSGFLKIAGMWSRTQNPLQDNANEKNIQKI